MMLDLATPVAGDPGVRAGPGGPRHPEIGVVGLVADAWTPNFYMARHHVLSRLGRWFNVAWLDRPPDWREAWWGTAGPRSRTGAVAVPGLPAGFVVARPGRWMPAVHRPALLSRWLDRARLRWAVRLLRRRGARHIVYYLWRPHFAWALEVPGACAALYHVVDEYTFSPADPPVAAGEAALLRAVNRVIVHSPGLMEKRGGFNRATSLIPNGVDFEAFATPQPVPAELEAIPRPRIGYLGILKRTLDLPLLLTVVRRHREWSFVFVGLDHLPAGESAALRGERNVFFIDQQPRQRLPGFVQHTDACILPYVLDGYTKYIYPLKLHEYLAAGRPVVATPIRSLEQHADVVTLAGTAEEWSAALTSIIARGPDPEAEGRRRALAQLHDWDALVDQVAALVLDITP